MVEPAAAAAPAATLAPAGDGGSQRAGAEVRGCEPLSSTTIHGRSSIVFGLPFLGVGAFVVLASLDAIPQPDEDFPCGRGIAAIAGALFGLAGVFLVVNGVSGVVRSRRAARGRANFPDMPWRFDRAWHRDGEDAARWSRAGTMLLATCAFGAFAALGAALGWAPGAPWFVRAVATVLCLITLLPLMEFLRRTGQAVRYGRTYVRWGRFPAFTGERLTLRFGVTRDSPRFTRVVLRLRCVQERYETRGSGDDRSTVVVCRALHEDARTVDEASAMPRPMCDATVHFELPADLPGNDLLSRPATFWEAEVEGEAPGLDYRQRFLLPVYSRTFDASASAKRRAAADVPAATPS